MNWYRKYRPQKIKELNLTKVREIFSRMLESGKIPQSMLFSGPKGTGKTSSSRIIGALLNDQANNDLVDMVYFNKKSSPKSSPKSSKTKKSNLRKKSFKEPDSSTDFAQNVYRGYSYVVQEMDAASNRGIDDIRSLKERVMLPPQEGKMSVYILDEAHMLTTEAFNALLKILEEPPPHVIFILATTELHKIPSTIISRCTTVAFYKATEDEVIEALDRVIKNEKITVEEESLRAIAKYADGSFRDAVKLLELACSSGSFSQEDLESVIGSSLTGVISELLDAVINKDEVLVSILLQELRNKNTNPSYFYKSLFSFLHTNLLQSLEVEKGEPFSNQQVIRFLLNQLLEVDLESPSPIAFLSLELKLLEIILRAKKKNSGENGERDRNKDKSENAVDKKKSQKLPKKPPQKEHKKETIEEKHQPEIEDDPSGISYSKLLFEKWEEFLNAVKSENSSLAALLHSSKPLEGINGLAKVGVYYRFHKEQLQQERFRDIIEKCSQDLVGKRVKFDFLLQEVPEDAALVQLDTETEEKVLAKIEAGKKADKDLNKKTTKSGLSAMAADTLM